MKEYSKDTIRDLILFLIAENYIKTIGNKYPILALNEKSNSVLFENEKVFSFIVNYVIFGNGMW